MAELQASNSRQNSENEQKITEFYNEIERLNGNYQTIHNRYEQDRKNYETQTKQSRD